MGREPSTISRKGYSLGRFNRSVYSYLQQLLVVSGGHTVHTEENKRLKLG